MSTSATSSNQAEVVRGKPQNLREALGLLVPWILFLLASALILRPVLLTAVTADDLINPFSQTYHAGTSIDPIMRRTWHFVSITGHFNYVGQSIGSFFVLIWMYLIGNFGIRYSTVYAISKFATYVICLVLAAEVVRIILRRGGVAVGRWHARIWVLIGVAGFIQLHVPWSNDPVASYPLAGYLTAAVGFGFILLVLISCVRQQLIWSVVTGLAGSFAVLYYEFNSFAVLAVGPFIAVTLWRLRTDRKILLKNMLHAAFMVGPAAMTTAFFYLKNRAASANYSGTAISLSGQFPVTFRNGIISAFPGSSWPIAREWLGHPVNFGYHSTRNFLLGVFFLGVLFAVVRKEGSVKRLSGRLDWTVLLALILGLGIYWLGATFTQTSTQKIQDEAKRIGQVYNYYAIAATCLAMIVIIVLVLVPWTAIKRPIVGLFAVILILITGYQYTLNWNVLAQFNAIMKPSRDLLAAYAEQPEMPERCAALDRWKLMGWPEYYWLDMELGLNLSNEIYHGESFCKR